MLEIDGSFGEAGGQILRTALSLSCLLKRPFRMFNIRKGRGKPGLMPQHLTSVRALASISDARVKGDSQGSTELVFEPAEANPGEYFFDIGTAGSTSLLLQAILPPLVFANGKSLITLRGGTHVPFSPPFHYISEVFVPFLSILGIRLHTSIERHGFYPKGGGKVTVEVFPQKTITGLDLTKRGEIKKVVGVSAVGNLPVRIAERQRSAAMSILEPALIKAEIGILEVQAFGAGTFMFLKSEAGDCIAGFSSLGERGKRAETVGEEAAREFMVYYRTGACIDHHLADQIVLYLSLAAGPSEFTTSRISNHLHTNLWVIEKFLGVKYRLEGEHGKAGTVLINP